MVWDGCQDQATTVVPQRASREESSPGLCAGFRSFCVQAPPCMCPLLSQSHFPPGAPTARMLVGTWFSSTGLTVRSTVACEGVGFAYLLGAQGVPPHWWQQVGSQVHCPPFLLLGQIEALAMGGPHLPAPTPVPALVLRSLSETSSSVGVTATQGDTSGVRYWPFCLIRHQPILDRT